jgi:hypothetical protein
VGAARAVGAVTLPAETGRVVAVPLVVTERAVAVRCRGDALYTGEERPSGDTR